MECCFGVVLGFIVIGIPRLVLEPLFSQTARSTHNLAQFRTLDIASLVWLLSLALGAVNMVQRYGYWDDPRPGTPSGHGMLLACGSLLAGCLWWIGLRIANGAGVQTPLARVLLCGVLVPFAYVATAFMFCPIWAAVVAAESVELVVVVYVVLCTGLVVGRIVASRIARTSVK
jgi:hypothetical protein